MGYRFRAAFWAIHSKEISYRLFVYTYMTLSAIYTYDAKSYHIILTMLYYCPYQLLLLELSS